MPDQPNYCVEAFTRPRNRTGKLLYNRVACDEHARITLRDGWKDPAWGRKNLPTTTLEGRIIAVSAHRLTIHVGNGHAHVLRRVDIDTIEVRL